MILYHPETVLSPISGVVCGGYDTSFVSSSRYRLHQGNLCVVMNSLKPGDSTERLLTRMDVLSRKRYLNRNGLPTPDMDKILREWPSCGIEKMMRQRRDVFCG